VIVAAVPWCSNAGSAELIDLSALVPGVSDAAAFGISPSGLVVGSVRVGGGEQKVAVWTASSGEVLDSDFGSEYAQSINDNGVIVGTYLGTATGWFYRDGAFDCIPLPDPCGSFNNIWRASSGSDVNRHDVFTGAVSPDASQPANDPVEAYLGSFADDGSVVIERLGDYLGASTRGTGLNDVGEVVGVSGSGLDTTALLFRTGQVIALPDLDGGYNQALDLNNDGLAVGLVSRPDTGPWPYDAEAARWDTVADPITVELLGRLPGHRLSLAADINGSGVVVGYSVDADFDDQRAVAWIDGQIVDLNAWLPPDSDWHLELATAVNDTGVIVGYGRRDGIPGRRAFMLRPGLMFWSGFEPGDLSDWSHGTD
jgi:probable HAF family extracellular repeat protein